MNAPKPVHKRLTDEYLGTWTPCKPEVWLKRFGSIPTDRFWPEGTRSDRVWSKVTCKECLRWYKGEIREAQRRKKEKEDEKKARANARAIATRRRERAAAAKKRKKS
jgi:hypothetical protein